MEAKTKRVLRRSAKLAVIAASAIYTVTGIARFHMEISAKNPEHTEAVEATMEPVETPAAVRAAESVNVRTLAPKRSREPEPTKEPEIIKSMDWSDRESYLLAKIAMAEAEGEDTEGKALVMLTVLNRVWSKGFPGTIEEVIMEEHGGVHQFSVTREGGRWYRVEPDGDCYKALELITSGHWDKSEGALYFESRSDSKWHQENLQFLFKHGNHYFYKEKGE